jgi:hypothetical protein
MRVRTTQCMLWLATFLASQPFLAAANADLPAPPGFLAPRDFSWKTLHDPENLFWPGYFWCWNGPLKPEVIRSQLADMAAHDARSVCVLPLPHEFRPDNTNNQMDVEYLSPEFFDRVRVAVDEAARLGMNYWLYDEGGWPSGQAAGQVLRARPDTAVRVLSCDANGKWTPKTEGMADLLNPVTTKTFLALTHQRYLAAVGSHFGKTIKLAFTDEPAYRFPVPGGAIPWPNGSQEAFRRRFGYDVTEKLDAFRVTSPHTLSPAQKQVRADLFDFWSRQFHDNYFIRLRDWSREHGLAHGGHLNGEDETFGAVIYGHGHAMRQLRALDVPGVDTIWRQVFPGKTNHHFPKFASSAAHQNGTALAFSESFCVYGNGLTPAQMKWITDFMSVRGITLLVGGCYSLSTRDHLMTGERPHIGPVDPLWDLLPEFHRYVARLGYVLACGQPAIETALYYPVRDIWASGDPADPALRGHDALAQALFRRQCDFDVIDDDVLADPQTHVEGGRLAVGPMRYRTIVAGPTRWMTDVAKKRLDELKAAGGQVVRVDDLAQLDAAVARIAPTVELDPPSPDIRTLVRRWPGGGTVFLFNEGQKPYRGTASLAIDGKPHEIEPATGLVRAVDSRPLPERGAASEGGDKQHVSRVIPVSLAASQSMLVVCDMQDLPATPAPPRPQTITRSVDLKEGWTARVDRQYVAGEHDFEVHSNENANFKPVALGRWATRLGLGEDFSGHVTYRRTVRVPEALRGGRLLLDLGGVGYAASVSIDGRKLGGVLWNPWCIELPPLGDRKEFVLEIEVANTLANELTSQRVRTAWASRKGPGWPSPYHQRALEFEVQSRGGGLLGPVRLGLATP